jgi:dihydroorotate dehydrogenase (NAD+) catalytic subunit
MNASGAGFSSPWLYRLAKAGAGAVVTKSIGPEPREGYNGPNVAKYGPGEWANAMGLPNPGVENYKIELRELKPALEPARIPIVVSVFGEGADGYMHVGTRAVEYGADALEINASCPHTELKNVEADPKFLKEVTRAVAETAHTKNVPVFVKLSPNIDYIESGKAAVEGGADGLVLTNTLRVRPTYDFPMFKDLVILGNPKGGFGGGSWKAVEEKSRNALSEAYREIDVPIFSAGGIYWRNIVERYLLGASGCQMATAFAYAQPEELFGRCVSALQNYLRENDCDSIKEIIGTGNKK